MHIFTKTPNTQLQLSSTMKVLHGCSLCLLLLLSALREHVESRTLHLDNCSVNVHFLELRKYYSDIQMSAISGDGEIGIKLLDKSLIKHIQDGQTCCFVRLMLRFYVERVFGNYATFQPHHQRVTSVLANAFVTIRKDVHKCHCQCGEDTQRKIDSVHAEFDKLQINQAAVKAVGELGTVLDWLDGLGQKTQP
ncbi:interleukin 19 like [Gouania willdenowi]|uniref:Interleukin family protein n=1 Tax=Gouania willdenowi TaxID=441366 RepID=A0A8C5E3Q0_GOUWI|nr:interleukin-20-like [Gouania willdenowi]